MTLEVLKHYIALAKRQKVQRVCTDEEKEFCNHLRDDLLAERGMNPPWPTLLSPMVLLSSPSYAP